MYGDGPIYKVGTLEPTEVTATIEIKLGRQEYIQKSLQQVERDVFVIFYACPFKLGIGRL